MNEPSGVRVLEQRAPVSTAPARAEWESFGQRVARVGPTLLVLGLLGGLAYVGHQTGWSIPKFGEMFGAKVAKDDWCAEHSVPESICVECDPSSKSREKSTWCRKHGVHNCPFEHPEVIQSKTPIEVKPEDLERAQRALDLKERKENNPKCKLHQRRIQFASAEIMDRMGIEVAPVWRGPVVETVSASGEISFNQPRVASVSVPVAGRIWHVTDKGQIGAEVKRGDVLALVDAAEVGKAKSEILQLFAQIELRKRTVDSIKPLVPQGAFPESKLWEADVALREARIRLMGALQALTNMGLPIEIDETKTLSTDVLANRLHFAGIPPELVATLNPRTTTNNLLPVVAAQSGTVIAAKVSVGEVVDAVKPLFVVADTERMWLMLNVRLEDAGFLRVRDAKTNAPGQTVKFRPDGSSKEVAGELVWKSREIDEKTRTLRYRAELPNADGTLLANTFGTGHIVLREEKDAIIVPNEAIHWEGDCHIVFVRDKNFHDEGAKKVFHVRTVRPGVTHGAHTEILAGVLPGEVIATKNSASLRAELLKTRLGAGCGCCP